MGRLAAPAATILAVLAVTGCAGRTGAGSTGSPPAAESPSTAPAGACRSGQVRLTGADDGRRLCVTAGTLVEVYLTGQPDAPWSTITADSAALRPVASGKRALPVGETAGFFRAAGQGTARLSASRPACPSAPAGGVRCLAVQGFTVTVEVR